MVSMVLSASVAGINSQLIQVEADVSNGMPIFEMVGYLASEVREARERVRTALRNSGYILPVKRITINLSPANMRKQGTGFDLPIAAAVLRSSGLVSGDLLSDTVIIGELSLNGNVNCITGVLPIVREAKEHGMKRCVIPWGNIREGKLIRGIEVIGVRTIAEFTDYLNGHPISNGKDLDEDSFELHTSEVYRVDFSEVKGQESLKRAAEIAVSGYHNLLMIGPPGAGKTMIAQRIPTILPELTIEESLELTSVYSICGILPAEKPMMQQRPFRMPYHTATVSAMCGGGRIPKPGEISLAHRGVLFLDEMPEFSRNVLEALRQPLEDKQVNLIRINQNAVYPADFMLIGAMNPCRCGFFPDLEKCRCTPYEVKKYLNRISSPLLDRLDITVEAQKTQYEQLNTVNKEECSAQIRKRVAEAHDIQRRRFLGTPYRFNSELPASEIKKYSWFGEQEERLLEQVYHKLELSLRSYYKILKVSRTIADLDGSENVSSRHISEAVYLKEVDRKYWTR